MARYLKNSYKQKRGLIFSKNLSETFLILSRTERIMVQNVYWSSRKVLVILVLF